MDHLDEATEEAAEEKTKGFFWHKVSYFWRFSETNKENVQSNSQPMVDDEEK